jgi:MFS family permease
LPHPIGSLPANDPKPFLFYGWWIVFTGLISYSLGYGARYSFAVFFPSLIESFHWPRDITAAIFSIHLFIYGIIAPMAGHMVDRIGPRPTMVTGASLLALGLMISGFGDRVWHFLLSFGVLAGAGLCLMGAVPFTTVVKNWFERKRGLAFSLLFFGVGSGFVFYPAISWLIQTVGWRKTFIIEGGIVAGITIPLFLLIIRYHPSEKGLRQDGQKEGWNDPPSAAGKMGKSSVTIIGKADDWTFPRAFVNLRFWLLALNTFCIWGVSENILAAHHFAYAVDCGFSKMQASSVLSLYGVMRCLGALSGLISDRIGREVTITIGGILATSATGVFILLMDGAQPWKFYYYALVQGYAMGLYTPTIAASVADIIRGPKVGWLIGLIWFSFAMGGTVGPWLGGWLFEINGNYRLAFLLAMGMNIVAVVAIWLAAPRKYRQAQRA